MLENRIRYLAQALLRDILELAHIDPPSISEAKEILNWAGVPY